MFEVGMCDRFRFFQNLHATVSVLGICICCFLVGIMFAMRRSEVRRSMWFMAMMSCLSMMFGTAGTLLHVDRSRSHVCVILYIVFLVALVHR